MDTVWEGLKLGLLLTVMIGPIFFAIVQASVEEGFLAGATVALGIWVSDILYILFVYTGIAYAAELIKNQTFNLTTSLLGAAILIAFGLGTFFTKPREFEAVSGLPIGHSYISLFAKGFLINTVNPFTIFFWFSVTSTMIVNDSFNLNQAFLFFGTIMLTIIITNLLQSLLAKKISERLTPQHLSYMRKITGVLLILFGIGLLVRIFL